MKTFFLIIFWLTIANADDSLNLSTFELRTAPVPLLYGRWYTIDATYYLNDKWAVGPSYIYYGDKSEYGGMFWPTMYGNAYGAHAIWAIDDLFTNSWYFGSHAYYEDYRSKAHGYGPGEEELITGYRVNAVLGFRQFSGNFLTMVGLGYETRIYDVKTTSRYENSEEKQNRSWFHAEFKAGWMF